MVVIIAGRRRRGRLHLVASRAGGEVLFDGLVDQLVDPVPHLAPNPTGSPRRELVVLAEQKRRLGQRILDCAFVTLKRVQFCCFRGRVC